MVRHVAKFLLAGVAWVFLLSIPVGQGKSVFDLAHYFLVDSAPVNWISKQFSKTVAQTDAATSSTRALTEDYLSTTQERLSDYNRSSGLSD
jgi:hypothetical protein